MRLLELPMVGDRPTRGLDPNGLRLILVIFKGITEFGRGGAKGRIDRKSGDGN